MVTISDNARCVILGAPKDARVSAMAASINKLYQLHHKRYLANVGIHVQGTRVQHKSEQFVPHPGCLIIQLLNYKNM